MLLWLFIFAGMLLAGVAGVVYLVRKIHRFRLPNTLAGDRRGLSWLFSTLLVAVPFVVLWLVWGMMNAAICLLHLVVFWLDLGTGCSGWSRRRADGAFRRYSAGLVAILFSGGLPGLGLVPGQPRLADQLHHPDPTKRRQPAHRSSWLTPTWAPPSTGTVLPST